MADTARRGGTFWNSEIITAKLGTLVTSKELPISPGQVREAAIELRLGPEAYVSGSAEKLSLRPNDMVAIRPGQIALLLTEESLDIPLDTLAFISLKTSVKVPGLLNVSGFHVDPGFRGRLVFTVYNAGTETCAFIRGQAMFLVWFATLMRPEPVLRAGKRQDQDTIMASDISHLTAAGASPARLDERIRRLEITLSIYGALLLGLVLAFIGYLLV